MSGIKSVGAGWSIQGHWLGPAQKEEYENETLISKIQDKYSVNEEISEVRSESL